MVAEHGMISLFVDQLVDSDDSETLKLKFFEYISMSRHDSTMKIGAANAITILNAAGISLSAMDFNGIKIPYTQLERSVIKFYKF